jgi:hypothetical protein
MMFEVEVHADLDPKVGVWLVWGEKGDYHIVHGELPSELVCQKCFHIREGLSEAGEAVVVEDPSDSALFGI